MLPDARGWMEFDSWGAVIYPIAASGLTVQIKSTPLQPAISPSGAHSRPRVQ
jgi:hypothetical protein